MIATLFHVCFIYSVSRHGPADHLRHSASDLKDATSVYLTPLYIFVTQWKSTREPQTLGMLYVIQL